MYGIEPTAIQWLRKAAEEGDAVAQYVVGKKYANGDGVEKNLAEAVAWFRKSAKLGYVKAETSLGVAYAKNYGVQQDFSLAVHWFKMASKRGYAKAQYNLGLMYANGRGVELDLVEARKWLALAAAQGHRKARDAALELEKIMKVDQVELASERAAEFYFHDNNRALNAAEIPSLIYQPANQRRFRLASSNPGLNHPEWLELLGESQSAN